MVSTASVYLASRSRAASYISSSQDTSMLSARSASFTSRPSACVAARRQIAIGLTPLFFRELRDGADSVDYLGGEAFGLQPLQRPVRILDQVMEDSESLLARTKRTIASSPPTPMSLDNWPIQLRKPSSTFTMLVPSGSAP